MTGHISQPNNGIDSILCGGGALLKHNLGFSSGESRTQCLMVEYGDQKHLARGRSLSPERVSPTATTLRTSRSYDNLEITRKEYNRQIGQYLNADKGKSVRGLTASSLLLIDKLLEIVKLETSIEYPPPLAI